jgi:hypothetical protein
MQYPCQSFPAPHCAHSTPAAGSQNIECETCWPSHVRKGRVGTSLNVTSSVFGIKLESVVTRPLYKEYCETRASQFLITVPSTTLEIFQQHSPANHSFSLVSKHVKKLRIASHCSFQTPLAARICNSCSYSETVLAAMAKGPAVVIVARYTKHTHNSPISSSSLTTSDRHGARLDAADKTWHLTSPTPYDPPLTYGGWSQGRALGLRIAALLHQRDGEQISAIKNGATEDPAHVELGKLDARSAEKVQGDGSQRPKKKRKIIIHSSPYLRCIQTSTAVAAGISQYRPPTTPDLKEPAPSKERNGSLGSSSVAKAARSKLPLLQSHTIEPVADPNLDVAPKPYTGPEKILLRIDAFLGEWLSPDYFEDITPPPNSTMMVAGAKADLLRRGDYIQEMAMTNNSKGFFPGGWGSKGPSGTVSKHGTENVAATTRASLASVSPFRERAGSQGSASLQRTKSRENVAGLPPSTHRLPSHIYEPPVPSYSVSPADSIPRGYVAHAQDACIRVDFQWDSMRPPQEWGNGGEYGDEWSTMHKLFRRGLAGMMQWYTEHGATQPKDPIRGFMFKEPLRLTPAPPKHAPLNPFPKVDGQGGAEDDEELVLILLTHGAGCNALLGAISNQPVLIDVGLASLSMAVRRAEAGKPSVSEDQGRRSSVADTGMSDTYEMKLLASTDHLRPGADPSKPQTPSQNKSPTVRSSPSIESRRRFTGSSGNSSPIESSFTIGEPYRNWNSSLGSIRRTMSSGSTKGYMQSNLTSSPVASPSASARLWSSPKLAPAPTAASIDGRSSPDMVLNFSNQQPKPQANTSIPSTTQFADDVPAVDGTFEITNGLTRLNTNEQKEVDDDVAPLRPRRHNRVNSTASSSGLWGAKPQPKTAHGLWGPPRLDDVYEHGRGPKRRWTMTEREDSV